MSKKLFVIQDEREVWWKAACAAAVRAGYDAKRIKSGERVAHADVAFLRPHATPDILKINQEMDWPSLVFATNAGGIRVQDGVQVTTYEDKVAQGYWFSRYMPKTWLFESESGALDFVRCYDRETLVSKARQGASSENVRVLHGKGVIEAHIREIFRKGIKVQCCDSKGSTVVQRDYVLLQEYIPHTVTLRVNRIGDAFAVFHRFNYKNRPVAQTGNVKPVIDVKPFDKESLCELLAFAADVTSGATASRWVALDILQRDSKYYLLETSLAWPWPSPGDCNKASFWRADGTRVEGFSWKGEGPGGKGDMFDLMFHEIERGAFAQCWGRGE